MSSLHSDLEACVQPLLDENNKDDQLDVKRKHRHTDRDTETQRHRDTEREREREREKRGRGHYGKKGGCVSLQKSCFKCSEIRVLLLLNKSITYRFLADLTEDRKTYWQ